MTEPAATYAAIKRKGEHCYILIFSEDCIGDINTPLDRWVADRRLRFNERDANVFAADISRDVVRQSMEERG